jgi:hypothetical protein
MRMIDKGFVELDYEVDELGHITLHIGYEADYLETELEIVYVRSEAGQDVETLFDEDAIYNECWEALEL